MKVRRIEKFKGPRSRTIIGEKKPKRKTKHANQTEVGHRHRIGYAKAYSLITEGKVEASGSEIEQVMRYLK